MNMLKRTLAMMLVLCMLFTMAPITAFAEDTTDPAGTASPAADGDLGDNITNKEVLKTSETPKIDESKDNETKDDVTQDDVTKDDVTKDDVTKDDVTKDDVTKDDVTKDDVTKDDVTKDDETKDDVTKDDVTKDDVTQDDETKDDVTKDDVTKDDVTKDDVTKDDETKDDVTKDDEDAEVTDPTEDPYGIAPATEDPYGVATAAVEPVTGNLSYASDYRILHLDCGRKYFTKDWIIALINEMEAAGYTHLELAVGNDNLRFLLDDMSVGSYSDAQVTAAIQAGNAAKHGAGELTQSDMDAIIAHAKSKNIGIIPLLNTPGHMYAIVTAMQRLGMSNPQFGSSASTVDVTNTEAVTFAQDLVKKYIDYFASKGCNEFNLGADEFANDDGNGQFSTLVYNGTYGNFIDYLNTLANYVVSKGMVPMAFNDGIYYNKTTSQGTIHPQIMVSYWSSGWWGYDLAPADYLAENQGFKMINTHGDWYFILTSNGITNPISNALNFNETSFYGSTVSDPQGSMFCIWCDVPGSATEEEVAAAARITLRKMAAAMKGTSSYSEEVIPGGFNVDGTIAEDCNNVTVRDENSTGDAAKVEVTGCDLTRVDVIEAAATQIPTIADAAAVLAWDITPYAGDTKYEGSATVKLPVPADWDTSLVKGFYVENGQAVVVEDSPCADGFCTFKMPHFSVGGLYQAVPAEEGDTEITDNRTIDLILGETATDVIEDGDYAGTYSNDVAQAAAVYEQVEGGTGAVQVDSVSVGSAYYLSDGNGKYLNANAEWTTDIDAASQWTYIEEYGEYYLATDNRSIWLYYDKNDGWSVSNYGDPFIISSGALAHYYFTDAKLIPYIISGTAPVNQTTVTFTGTAIGSAAMDIGPVRYTVNVAYKEKTINIEKEGTRTDEQSVTVGDYMADAAMTNDYVTASWSGNTVTFTAKNQTGTVEMIIGNTKYTVNVIEVDLSTVTPLTIEFFITNQRVPIDTNTQMSLAADAVYSEDGVDFAELVPASDNAENPKVLWRGWLLPEGYHQEGENTSTDMCTDSHGTRIQKLRYWNAAWQYFNGTAWVDILDTDQVVAYYVQETQVTDEVTTNVTDWGETYESWAALGDGNHWFWDGYVENGSKFVFMDFAVVYEDGTQVPDSFPRNDTWFYHFEDCSATNPRVMKPLVFLDTSDYEIWKITVTDGTSNGYQSASTFTSSYDNDTETVVWTEETGGIPRIEALAYTANQSGKLIRIYIRAVEREDSLKVVYFDEKFGSTLVEYNVIVPDGSNFNDSIVQANTDTSASLPAFTGNPNRKDATGYGIVNSLGRTQNFRTDLTQVPEAVGKYNSNLYAYTGSEISTDGTTITHYYTIDQSVVYPNYVADFGMPITFELGDIVSSAIETVTDVTVVGNTRYGTLSYDDSDNTFLYTPAEVIRGLDVLTINVTFDGGTTQISNVGVTPATTVYYEESFLTYGSNWSTVPTKPSTPQSTEQLNGKRYNFGYDPFYANHATGSNNSKVSTDINGATASFTFTGTGFALYANCNKGTGYVTLTREGSTKKMYMMDTGLNYAEMGVQMPGTTATPSGWFYNIPVITEKNLPYGEYTVTIRKTNNDGENLEIDGIRIYNTIQDSSIFVQDLEDNPVFYEMRDVVLKALGVQGATSSQVYAALPDDTSAVVTDGSVDYANTDVQALLNNGPKNEVYLHPNQTLTFKITTDRVVQIGLKAPNGTTKYQIGDRGEEFMDSCVDMFYSVLGKATEEGRPERVISVKNTGSNILAVTDLKVCDDPGFSFAPLNEADIAALLHEDTEPEAPTYTMVELKGTDVFIDGTVFDYTGEAIEPAITVNVNGTQLVEGRDYTVTYTNNVQPGTATVTVRGIATASETLGYTGEVSIDYTINAPAEPEVPEETTKPTKPGKPEKPDNGNKPGNNRPTDSTKPGNGNNRPGNGNNNSGKPSADKNEKQKDAKLKITFVNLMGKKVASATLTKTGTANQRCVFSLSEISAQAPARRLVIWLMPVVVPYGSTSSIIIPVL